MPALSQTSDRSHVLLVCSVVFFEFASFGIANPILPQLIGDLNRTAIPTAAYVFSIFLVADVIQFFWAPAIGSLSDRLGRRWILVLSVVGVSIGNIARYFADEIYIFLLVSILSGFVSATLPTAMSSAADVVGKERRTAVFGWITGMAVSGYTVGPIIGGVLSDIDNRLPFLAAAMMSVANLLFVLMFLKETLPKERRTAKRIGLKSLPFSSIRKQSPHIKMLLTLYFSSHFVLSMPHTFVVIYLIDRFAWTGTMIGFGLAMHMFVASVGQLFLSGRLSRRWGELRVILLSVLLGALFLILLGLGEATLLILAAFALFGSLSMAIPAIASLVSANTPPEDQGEIQGIMASMMGLARVALFGGFGPVFAIVADRSASPAISGLPFVLVGLCLLAFLVWVRGRLTYATAPERP